MSTNSVIAKPDGDSWLGTYVHWDGYPTGVGTALYEAHEEAFGGDTDAMIVALVDAEPVGWSSICGHDLSKPGWWTDDHSAVSANPKGHGPLSYSARGEAPQDGVKDWQTPDNHSGEYVYILTSGGLMAHDVYSKREILVPWGQGVSGVADLALFEKGNDED